MQAKIGESIHRCDPVHVLNKHTHIYLQLIGQELTEKENMDLLLKSESFIGVIQSMYLTSIHICTCLDKTYQEVKHGFTTLQPWSKAKFVEGGINGQH